MEPTSRARWPWDEGFSFEAQYENPLVPVRYPSFYPVGQRSQDSRGAFDMLPPYQQKPPSPLPPPPTLPPIPTANPVAPLDDKPAAKLDKVNADLAKPVVSASGPSTSVPDPDKARIVMGDKPKVKPLKAVDAVYDPSVSTKDICVQLDIPIEDDPRTNLEMFSRFKRLGRFNDSKEFFETQLDHFRTTPYVFVQYAEMLLAGGDFKAFRHLTYPDDFFHTGPAPPNTELAASFEMMKFLAQPIFVDYPTAITKVVWTTFTFLITERIWGSTHVCSPML